MKRSVVIGKRCSEHEEESNVCYCNTCKQVTCFQCVTAGMQGKHYKHAICTLAEAQETTTTGELTDIFEQVSTTSVKLQRSEQNRKQIDKTIRDKVAKETKRINDEMDTLVDQLEAVRTLLITAVLRAAQKQRNAPVLTKVRKSSQRVGRLSRTDLRRVSVQCLKDVRKYVFKVAEGLKAGGEQKQAVEEVCFLAKLAEKDVAGASNLRLSVGDRWLDDIHTLQEMLQRLQLSVSTIFPKSLKNVDKSKSNESEVVFCVGGEPWECGRQVVAYDTKANKWYSASAITNARVDASATIWNNKLLVSGGFTLESGERSDSVEQYEPENDHWSAFSKLLTARSGHAMVNLNGTLFTIGGYTGHTWLNSVERYDAEEDIWTLASPMCTPRNGLAAATLQDSIVVAGGRNGSEVQKSCELYDSVNNVWSQIASMNKKRWFAAAASHWNTVYVFGGLAEYSQVWDDVEQFDKKSNKWTLLDSRMSVGRCSLAAAVSDGLIYLIGGSIIVGTEGINEVECFDTKNGRFSGKTPLPTASCGLAAASLRLSPEALNRLAASKGH